MPQKSVTRTLLLSLGLALVMALGLVLVVGLATHRPDSAAIEGTPSEWTVSRADGGATGEAPSDRLPASARYAIALQNVEESQGVVRGEITTNMPLPVEVMVSLSLSGQADNDVFIGNDTRVRLARSPQPFEISTLDGGGPNTVDARYALPRGEYDVEVAFYPRWGAENGNVQARLIEEEVRAVERISLGGGEQSASAAAARSEAQRWVALHLDIGAPWNQQAIERQLGSGQRFRISGDMNPNVIVGFYFERADTTVFVNVVRNEVAMWRYGRHDAP